MNEAQRTVLTACLLDVAESARAAIHHPHLSGARQRHNLALVALVAAVRVMVDESCPEPWWTDHHNLRDLIAWLEKTQGMGGYEIDRVLEVLDKPWKWTVEFEQMRSEKVLETH